MSEEENFSDYRLSKWRRLLLVRDSQLVTLPGGATGRVAWCPMCNGYFAAWRLQAHHIRPKSLHGDQAYQLSNGICLCLSCHMGKVHGGNSFEDMRSVHQWRFFVPSFDRYVNLARCREFAEENQHRI